MNKENNATEGAETAVNGVDGAGGVNAPEDKKNANTGDGGGNAGVYVHKFKKPFEYEDKKYTTLNFYFERLTGKDLVAIENEMQANNEYALDPLLSRNLQGKLSARAAGIAGDVLEAMPLPEFNKIVNAARNFLIDSGY
jgi:hypothetical protein